MTKNAQQALRYLLQNYSNNVRFCLICNYISKIDDGLQNEFLKLCFKQLPSDNIIDFLKNISDSEQLNFSYNSLKSIQQLYKSDIRSMINFIQSNQNFDSGCIKIIDDDIWGQLLNKISNKENINNISNYIHSISLDFNIDKKNIIKDFLNYIIKKQPKYVNTNFLDFVENLIHSQNHNNDILINYLLSKSSTFLSIPM
jgi:DNA polymerase III delta prime subunit